MKIHIIVAMSENRVIGKDNGLPWHLPADLAHFKTLTMGHPMIMGRRTYESIGRPLPGRTSIVVTRDSEWCAAEGVIVVGSIDEAFERAKVSAECMGVDSVMVVGGANIYMQTLEKADEIYVTEVHSFVEGDAYFPELPKTHWQEVSREHFSAAEAGLYAYAFVHYKKYRNA